MPDVQYRLSPYCVLHPYGGDAGAILIHGLYGSRFELSTALLRVLADILDGAPPSEASRHDTGAAEAVDTLIAERVLVGREEADRLAEPAQFRSRLQPVELAFHRGFNEGGFFPDDLDAAHPPAMVKHIDGTPWVPLETHPSLEVRKDLTQ